MKKYLSFFILCFFLNLANVLAQSEPIAHLSVDQLSIEENGGVSKLTISLKDASGNSMNASSNIDVAITISGSATLGSDYSITNLTNADNKIITISSGSSSAFLTLTTINDTDVESEEKNSTKYKKLWIQNNIEQPDDVIVTGRKESYAKDKASGTPNILIDDRPVNIQRWQGAGGYGILYQANRDSLTKVKQALDQYGKYAKI